jgi:hypothetical protein
MILRQRTDATNNMRPKRSDGAKIRPMARLRFSLLAAVLGCTPQVSRPMVEPDATIRLESITASGATTRQSKTRDNPTIIGTLKFKDVQLVMHTSRGAAEGLRFTVIDDRSNVVATAVPEGELVARFPELHRAYNISLARGGAFLDARIEQHYLRPLEFSKDQAPAILQPTSTR